MDSSALQVVIKILGISWSCLLACLFAQKVFIGYLALIMALWIQTWKMVHVCKEPRSDLGWELWSSGAPSVSGVDPALGIHKGDSLALLSTSSQAFSYSSRGRHVLFSACFG